jgi:demethylmenaquinone methyltransferase / 2-methoxy-6-polyprenyl-1,4-benzoquinol methylase
MTSLREVYCASYEQIGAPVTESIRPHPVLEEYYPVQSDRQSFVDELFNGSAKYYNHIGRMLDWGSGPMYRRQALQRAGLKKGMRLLDVATGTGLVALGGAEVVGDARRVVGIDPNSQMLREARMALASPLVRGRAEILPFRSDTFDMLSMGFALRHVEDLETAFSEYRRVLKPGGRMLLIEVSRPKSRIMRWVIRTHFQRVLPWLARITTGSEPAQLLMKFYWDTIDQCVPPDTILDVLRRNGFVDLKRRVWCGFLSEYVAVKSRGSA